VPVAGIILAAGASRRMGRPKSLLPLGGGTFLSRIAATMRDAGVTELVVVLGADAGLVRPTMGWYEGTVIVNDRWEEGQLSSVIAGLNALAGSAARGALLWPVDHPLAGAGVVCDLIAAFERYDTGIFLPACRGRRGHPALFSRAMYPALRSASPLLGARDVLAKHPDQVREVPTEDEGVLHNIDSPDDVRRLGLDRDAP
jgi:CTP:molybdopterin cytidylyltransferase MocA